MSVLDARVFGLDKVIAISDMYQKASKQNANLHADTPLHLLKPPTGQLLEATADTAGVDALTFHQFKEQAAASRELFLPNMVRTLLQLPEIAAEPDKANKIRLVKSKCPPGCDLASLFAYAPPDSSTAFADVSKRDMNSSNMVVVLSYPQTGKPEQAAEHAKVFHVTRQQLEQAQAKAQESKNSKHPFHIVIGCTWTKDGDAWRSQPLKCGNLVEVQIRK